MCFLFQVLEHTQYMTSLEAIDNTFLCCFICHKLFQGYCHDGRWRESRSNMLHFEEFKHLQPPCINACFFWLPWWFPRESKYTPPLRVWRDREYISRWPTSSSNSQLRRTRECKDVPLYEVKLTVGVMRGVL
jgi:hypothetical protein